MAERFFAPEEYDLIMSAPESERSDAFTRLWALKESFLKATGLGLTLPLSAFTVRVGEDGVSVRQDVDGNRYRFFELDRFEVGDIDESDDVDESSSAPLPSWFVGGSDAYRYGATT